MQILNLLLGRWCCQLFLLQKKNSLKKTKLIGNLVSCFCQKFEFSSTAIQLKIKSRKAVCFFLCYTIDVSVYKCQTLNIKSQRFNIRDFLRK